MTAIELIKENKRTKNVFLDLGNCGLTELPKELFDCVWLRGLNLGDTDVIIDFIEEMTLQEDEKILREYMRKLNNTPTRKKKTDIPNRISNINGLQYLDKLEMLYLENNKIEDIEILKPLTKLKRLNISDNKVTTLSIINNFKELEYLNVSNNNFSSTKITINFKKLKELTISSTNIREIIIKENINNLEELYASGTVLSNISFLSNMPNIGTITLGEVVGNNLNDLLKAKKLYSLSIPNMNKENIKTISQLRELSFLMFQSDAIEDISILHNLKKLQTLLIMKAPVKEILCLKNLSLDILSVQNTLISDIEQLKPFRNCNLLSFSNTPLYKKIPKELQSKLSEQEALQYLIDNQDAKPLREAKVIFIGEGSAGKTSLIDRLITGKNKQFERTDKIDIRTTDTLFKYKREGLKVHFWDFGGQEIMHATHKFFMTEGCVYVIVTNGRKTPDWELQSWIEQLKTTCGDSPVLLVANHMDDERDSHQLKDRESKRDFDNICLPVIETSWKKGRGIDDLHKAIEQAFQSLSHLEEDFPVKYWEVKQELEKLDEPYIDYQTFEKYCEQTKKTFDPLSQSILADRLNSLGVMLNFRKRNDRLEDLLIFKPEWIINGVYKIINAKATQKEGRISKNEAYQVLKEAGYTTNQERNFVMEMMEHFKLTYTKDYFGEIHYLIPSTFDKNRPDNLEWNPEKVLRFRIQYDNWRKDYISYFLVGEHKFIQENNVWREGAVLNYAEGKAFVETFSAEKRIDIEVDCKGDSKLVLWQIRRAFDEVHNQFVKENLGVSEKIVYEENGIQDVFDYQELLGLLKMGEIYKPSVKLGKRIPIQSLLDGVDLPLITQIIRLIEKTEIAEAFKELEKYIKDEDKVYFHTLKNKYMMGNYDVEFHDQLKTFVRKVVGNN